jgi:hypothetical protein
MIKVREVAKKKESCFEGLKIGDTFYISPARGTMIQIYMKVPKITNSSGIECNAVCIADGTFLYVTSEVPVQRVEVEATWRRI